MGHRAAWRKAKGRGDGVWRAGFDNDRPSPPPPRQRSQSRGINRVVPQSKTGQFAVLIRSIVFNALFYLNMVVQMGAGIPTMVMPRGAIVAVVKFWARTNLWLLRKICGIVVEFRGLEGIPPGALIVASKHQSMWETFALFQLFADPSFILKRAVLRL